MAITDLRRRLEDRPDSSAERQVREAKLAEKGRFARSLRKIQEYTLGLDVKTIHVYRQALALSHDKGATGM